MTANIPNTGSAIKMLENALEALDKSPEPRPGTFWQVFLYPYLDSVKKCFVSLAAQIRFYESAKCTTGSLTVTHPCGRQEHLSGRCVEALRLPLPDLEQDFVIYGRPDALRAVAKALDARGWPATGPAPVPALARQLAANAAITHQEAARPGETYDKR